MRNAYENMERVNEDLIKKAAVLSGPNNSFLTALEFAEEYRRAGLTPAFLLDEEKYIVIVTTEEKMNGEFN